MVFFICNHCGESLKKQVVLNHSWRCKRDINVSCMDCQKDFIGQAYDAHTVCISEAEKYSAKGYVPKLAKGAQKQESWLNNVRSIPERNKNLSPGVKKVFEVIMRNDNIPRKKPAFLNFFKNSNRSLNTKDLETTWSFIEQQAANEKQTSVQTTNQKKEEDVPTKNGETGPVKNDEKIRAMEYKDTSVKQKKIKTKQSPENDAAPLPKKQKMSKNVPEQNTEEEEPSSTKQKKRKTKDTSENGQKEEESNPSKQKKCKTYSSQNGTENGTATLMIETQESTKTDTNAEEQERTGCKEKFNLSETIRQYLVSRNNQMNLSKLKKKVMKRYQQASGEEVDEKFEKKFQKKIAKSGFVVENNVIRLVEA
uniref:Uncharacterized protein n=1 Tax=Anopheles funestus TaxID=62324 RepID=A0A4Y0BFW7_ANOFN